MEDSLKRLIEAVPPPPPEPESKPHIPLQCFHRDFNVRCGSPALKGEYFCYFHNPKYTPARILIDPTTSGFELPPLDSREAIQSALNEVSRRIARNTIDPKRAGLLLRSIRSAIVNLTSNYLVHAAAAKLAESPLPADPAAATDVRVPHPSQFTGVPGERSSLAGVVVGCDANCPVPHPSQPQAAEPDAQVPHPSQSAGVPGERSSLAGVVVGWDVSRPPASSNDTVVPTEGEAEAEELPQSSPTAPPKPATLPTLQAACEPAATGNPHPTFRAHRGFRKEGQRDGHAATLARRQEKRHPRPSSPEKE